MFSSQQKFVVNGEFDETLEDVLQFALHLSGSKIKAFYEDTNGLVLCEYDCNDCKTYPFNPTPKVLAEQIQQYIEGLSFADKVRLAGPEPDNDGTVILGWELFHPLWYGEYEIKRYELAALLAVRPCWIVYGK